MLDAQTWISYLPINSIYTVINKDVITSQGEMADAIGFSVE
jgi:hypothetical protein